MNEFIYKTEIVSQTSKANLQLPKKKRWQGGKTSSLGLKYTYYYTSNNKQDPIV